MANRLGPDDVDIVLRFGGGVHSRASEADIDERECEDGRNFQLDVSNMEFRRRAPFDLVGTVPNAAEIRGFVTLLQTDGTIKTAVQAGATVYDWDGGSTFTSIATVDSTAKLRGRLSHQWQLDDKVLITDLNLAEEVYEWDGTAGGFSAVSFVDEGGSAAFGTFRAKYCVVQNERAIFANVHDNGTNFGHLIVGTQRSNFTVITVTNRPSSALAEADPFFLIQPDLRSINAFLEIFDSLAITSGKKGNLYKMAGSSAQDFEMLPFYPRSGVDGDEAITNIVGDAVYGRAGVVELLSSTDKFGDVETDDLSLPIADQITSHDDWVIEYNSRTRRIYCHSPVAGELWVLHKPMIGSGLSPWIRYVTDHPLAFTPTAMMSVLDPSDGLEYVLMGDASGNVFRLEGTGSSGDGGTADIKCERLSKLFTLPQDAESYHMEGYVRYRKGDAITLTLKFEYAGYAIFTEEVQVTLPAETGGSFWGGNFYWGGDFYWGGIRTRLSREPFSPAAGSNEFQIRATIEGSEDFTISEIGLRFTAATT